jgi:hypothetical protein
LRAAVVAIGRDPAASASAQDSAEDSAETAAIPSAADRDRPPRASRIGWARLLARIHEVLALLCPACGGEMRILAFLVDPPVVQAILLPLGLPRRPFGGGVFEDQREPYIPKPKWTLGADGRLAFGCPDTYEFDVVQPNGHVLRIRRDDWRPVELSNRAREWLTWYRQWPFPATKPAYARVLLAPVGGRIWVRPEVHPVNVGVSPEAEAALGLSENWRPWGAGVFDVFDREGVFLGPVRMPPEMSYSGHSSYGITIHGDTVWAITEGEFDEAYISKYLVRWPGR